MAKMRRALAAVLCLVAAQAAYARAYGVEDMLALEQYGKAIFDLHGRWAAIEKLGPYGAGHRYDYDSFTGRALTKVMRVELDGTRRLVPLFRQDKDTGYWMGTPSPSGARLTVFRLEGERLALGVAEPTRGTVRWLAARPATPLLNPHPVWLGDDRLLMVEAASSELGFPLDTGMRLQRELTKRWAATAGGKIAGVSVIGSRDGALGTIAALVEIDLLSGARRTLVRDRIVDLALSADRRWAAITVETAHARPDPGSPVTTSDLAFEHRVRVIELATGRTHDVCGDCLTIPNLLAWSPSGARLLFYARPPGTSWSEGALFVHDAARLTTETALAPGIRAAIPANDTGAAIVTAAWIDGAPALLGSRDGDAQPHWLGPAGPIGSIAALPCVPRRLGAAALGLVAICGDEVFGISKGRTARLFAASGPAFARVFIQSFDIGIRARFDPVERSTAIAVGHEGPHPQARWIDGASVTAAIALPRDVDRMLGGPQGGAVLATSRDPHGVSALWLARPGKPPVQIDTINEHLSGIDWPRFERIDAGAGRFDWLMLPPGTRRGARLPLVVIPYPGTEFGAERPRFVDPDKVGINVNAQLLASAGFAVLLPSMAERRTRDDPVDGMAAEVEAAADRAVATGRIDPDRIVIYGHSYGGYAAIAVATQSRRFAAYAASAAPIGLVDLYGRFLPYDRVALADGFPKSFAYGWLETSQGGMKAPPWAAPERYVRNDPLLHLDRIDRPVLLIGGDLDYAGVSGAERLYAGLYRLGRDATLIRYWGEGHYVTSPANIRDMDRRLIAWLREKLGQVQVSPSARTRAPAK